MEGCRWEGQNLQQKEVQRLIKKNDLDYCYFLEMEPFGSVHEGYKI